MRKYIWMATLLLAGLSFSVFANTDIAQKGFLDSNVTIVSVMPEPAVDTIFVAVADIGAEIANPTQLNNTAYDEPVFAWLFEPDITTASLTPD